LFGSEDETSMTDFIVLDRSCYLNIYAK